MTSIAKHVIDKCGGPKAVAEMLSIDVSSVHKWKYSTDRGGTGGLVPSNRQQDLLDKARLAGIDLSPADFFAITSTEFHSDRASEISG